jgi:predicted phosphoadenosine phosphosulfate sulfurtransferase
MLQQGRKDALSESQSVWIIWLNESGQNWIKHVTMPIYELK